MCTVDKYSTCIFLVFNMPLKICCTKCIRQCLSWTLKHIKLKKEYHYSGYSLSIANLLIPHCLYWILLYPEKKAYTSKQTFRFFISFSFPLHPNIYIHWASYTVQHQPNYNLFLTAPVASSTPPYTSTLSKGHPNGDWWPIFQDVTTCTK